MRALGIASPALDPLCALILTARIPQSLVHVCFEQTDRVVSVRFAFYFVQLLSFCVLIALIAWPH